MNTRPVRSSVRRVGRFSTPRHTRAHTHAREREKNVRTAQTQHTPSRPSVRPFESSSRTPRTPVAFRRVPFRRVPFVRLPVDRQSKTTHARTSRAALSRGSTVLDLLPKEEEGPVDDVVVRRRRRRRRRRPGVGRSVGPCLEEGIVFKRPRPKSRDRGRRTNGGGSASG